MNATKEDVSSKLFNFLFRQPLLCTESQLRETFYNQGEESFLKYIYTDRSSLIDTLGEREREGLERGGREIEFDIPYNL